MIKYIKRNKFLFICLSIIFIGSYFASLIQTSLGKVEIELKSLEAYDGQTLVYDLYKPKLATQENKVPFVIVVPGFQRSKEALSKYPILFVTSVILIVIPLVLLYLICKLLVSGVILIVFESGITPSILETP